MLLKAEVLWGWDSTGTETEPKADCRAATGNDATAAAEDAPCFASCHLPCS